MITCEVHPDNEGECIHCLNEVIAQRDDYDRRWRAAEKKIVDLVVLLRETVAAARRFYEGPVLARDTESHWKSMQLRVREVLDQETPPSVELLQRERDEARAAAAYLIARAELTDAERDELEARYPFAVISGPILPPYEP